MGFSEWSYGSLGPREKLEILTIYPNNFTNLEIKDYLCQKVSMNFTSISYMTKMDDEMVEGM